MSPLLQAFVTAMNQHDSESFIACFTHMAVVRDEKRRYKGVSAILAWYEEVTRKYRFTLKVIEVSTLGNKTVLTAKVAGNFEGSPILLNYHLAITGGKISGLSIKD